LRNSKPGEASGARGGGWLYAEGGFKSKCRSFDSAEKRSAQDDHIFIFISNLNAPELSGPLLSFIDHLMYPTQNTAAFFIDHLNMPNSGVTTPFSYRSFEHFLPSMTAFWGSSAGQQL